MLRSLKPRGTMCACYGRQLFLVHFRLFIRFTNFYLFNRMLVNLRYKYRLGPILRRPSCRNTAPMTKTPQLQPHNTPSKPTARCKGPPNAHKARAPKAHTVILRSGSKDRVIVGQVLMTRGGDSLRGQCFIKGALL
jgi:hypothetical protein